VLGDAGVSTSFETAQFYNQVEDGHPGDAQWSLYLNVYGGAVTPTEAFTFVSETLDPAASSNSGFDEWTYVFSYDHNILTGGATGFTDPHNGFGVVFQSIDNCTVMGSIISHGVLQP